ncbi:MAG: hypothetical protein MI755_04190 [Sphingomonadales bacterium]|nr:hypothetical protein [Sphingomonadales bacterium]
MNRYHKQEVEERMRKRRKAADHERREDRFLNFMLGLFIFLSVLLVVVFLVAVTG